MIRRHCLTIAASVYMALVASPRSLWAVVLPGGVIGDEEFSVLYDPTTGELAFDVPLDQEVTSVGILSAGRIFTGEPAQNLGGSLDHDRDNEIFKAVFPPEFNIGSISFGNVAPAGLTESFLLGDLTVLGSLRGGGGIGDTTSASGPSAPVDLVYIPEPSAIALFVFGAAGFWAWWTCSSRRSTAARRTSALKAQCP